MDDVSSCSRSGMSDGQITVRTVTLDDEGRPGGTYKFYIRAIDPSGERD